MHNGLVVVLHSQTVNLTATVPVKCKLESYRKKILLMSQLPCIEIIVFVARKYLASISTASSASLKSLWDYVYPLRVTFSEQRRQPEFRLGNIQLLRNFNLNTHYYLDSLATSSLVTRMYRDHIDALTHVSIKFPP